MFRKTVRKKIEEWLSSSDDIVFLRKELDRYGDYRQVSRALADITKQGSLVRVGYGVYARAIKSPLTGRSIPRDSLVAIGLEALKKMGVDANIGSSEKALQEGRSTQVPMLPVIAVGRARVRRKIGFGERVIAYEAD